MLSCLKGEARLRDEKECRFTVGNRLLSKVRMVYNGR